jgi:tetratricopeptide (TPR) repeat protein
MKRVIVAVALMGILAGCSNPKYDEAMKSGDEAFKKENYQAAALYYQDAIKIKDTEDAQKKLKWAQDEQAKYIQLQKEKEAEAMRQAETLANDEYKEKIANNAERMSEALKQFGTIAQSYEPTNAWKIQMKSALAVLNEAIEEAHTLETTDKYAAMHKVYMQAIDEYDEARKLMLQAIDKEDKDKTTQAMKHMKQGITYTEKAVSMIP